MTRIETQCGDITKITDVDATGDLLTLKALLGHQTLVIRHFGRMHRFLDNTIYNIEKRDIQRIGWR